jgi:hypothetical protein
MIVHACPFQGVLHVPCCWSETDTEKAGTVFPSRRKCSMSPYCGTPMNTRYTVFDAEEMAEKIIVASLMGKRREKVFRYVQDNCILSKVLKEWLSILVE